MTAIANPFIIHARARQRAARSLWSGISAGLAIALIGLTMTVLGTSGRSGWQSDQLGLGGGQSSTARAFDSALPVDFFAPE